MNILKFLAFVMGCIIYIFKVPVKHCLSGAIARFTQLLRKKIGLKKRYNSEIQNQVKTAVSSGSLRVLLEERSTLRRTNVDSPSGTLRLLFDCASTPTRSAVEALPKPSRRAPEHVSTMSQRYPKAEPKASRLGGEVSPSRNFFLTNFAPIPAFHAVGLGFCFAVTRILSEGDPKPTRRKFEQRWEKGGNWLPIEQVLVEKLVVNPVSANTVESKRSVLRSFKAMCSSLALYLDTLLATSKVVAQRALKCFLSVADYKHAYRIILTCLFLCLVSMFSLSAQTPRKDSGADGPTRIRALQVGDPVGDDFYTYVHKTVDWSSKAVSQANLSLHKNKLIILEFWAPWCSPCLGSLKKLDSLKKNWDQDKVVIIPVTTIGLKDISKTLNYFKWDYQSIYEDSFLTTRFSHQALPFMVWIKDGRVIATPKAGYANTANINAVLNDSKFEVFNKTEVKLIDTNTTLFTKDNGLPDHVIYDSQDSKLVGYISGYTATNFNVFKTRDSLSLYAINSTIDRIYREAYKDQIYPYQSKKSAIRWNVGGDFTSYLEESRPKETWTGDLYKDKQLEDWKRQHYFSIMVRVPRDSGINGARIKMQKLLAAQIEGKFGLKANVQYGEMRRYPILIPLNTIKQAEIRLSRTLQRPPKKGYENYAVPFGDQPHFKLFIENALKNLKSLELTEYRIWDRTGIAPDFPAKFSFPIALARERKFGNIQNLLKQYGLQIVIEEKPTPYLHISQSVDHSNSKGHENL
ncbi:TlpA disulfide reductase family protein [Sphingobacterium sp.]|uniref:TlpA family protein disulfide reductase n=1 Tax=Sphingobacterium sp. TaxID=341027 RepID=UPI0028A1E36F|nr:TlpA disulfide reductase family protein [Sphingobacterium sp.]